jgi:hypothetical protein
MDFTPSAPVTRFSDSRPRAASPGELAVVREMLATLDTLTTAGQQHTMAKLVGFIQDRSIRVLPGISSRNRERVAELLAHLERECHRALPDVRSFSDRADRVVTLLTTGAPYAAA